MPLPAGAPRADRPSTPARTGPSWLLVTGIVLVALNLRTPVTSLGALLTEVSDGVGLSPALAGVATMLPTLCFALAGSTAPWLARRFPAGQLLLAAMVLLAVGLTARSVTSAPSVFIATSALSLAGIAVANVLMPALVRAHFPERIGLLTGVYTMCMIFGNSAAAAASVPVAQLTGSWRIGLGVWAVLAVVAALPWLPGVVRDHRAARAAARAAGPRRRTQTRVRPAATGLGWLMALYFGTQSLNGYVLMGWLSPLFRDVGFSAATAGLLLALVTTIGVPVAFLTPNLVARIPDLRPIVLGLSAASILGYVGLAIAPAGAALLWVGLLAIGQAAFPFALTLIGLRARTAEGTVALSAFTQSVGYLLAGVGPLLVGVLYGATGGWTAPLGFLIVTVVVQGTVGLAIARPRYIEDAGR